MTDGEWLSQYRREGRDYFFAHYLLGRKLRILGAIIERDLLAPVFTPVLNWLSK